MEEGKSAATDHDPALLGGLRDLPRLPKGGAYLHAAPLTRLIGLERDETMIGEEPIHLVLGTAHQEGAPEEALGPRPDNGNVIAETRDNALDLCQNMTDQEPVMELHDLKSSVPIRLQRS